MLQRRSIARAIQCLDVQEDNDTYTMALMAYAFTLYNVDHAKRGQIMQALEQRAKFKGQYLHFIKFTLLCINANWFGGRQSL